jgi:Holliday junction resolvase RusA-like endonuclease
VIYGDPVAQGRGRATVVNGRVIVYDPAKSREFKRLVKYVAQRYRPERLISGAISLTVKAYISIPKSFSKKKKELALSGELRPTKKPDIKNIIAGIEDALEQVIYDNDSQIVEYDSCGKWYGDPPRVEVSLSVIPEPTPEPHKGVKFKQ